MTKNMNWTTKLGLSMILAGCSAGGGAAAPLVSDAGQSTTNDAGSTPDASSSSPDASAPDPDAATIGGDETWADGKQIAASIRIPKGVTVTIAPGAKITVADG